MFGHYEAAEGTLQKMVRKVEKTYGKNSLEVGYILTSLGLLLQRDLRCISARPILKRVVEIFSTDKEAKAEKIVTAHNNLGLNSACLGKLEQAEQHYREALAIAEDRLPPTRMVWVYKNRIAHTA